MLYTISNPNTSKTPSFHNNLLSTTLLWVPRLGECYPVQVSTLPYPEYLPILILPDTLPEYLPYPTDHRKNTPPYIEYLSHLPHPRHLSLHTRTHLTLPFITYPNLHFPTLYYCQGLIKYKAETIYQIRPKRPRTETTQAETTQGRNDSGLKRTTRECSCGCRTGTYM